MIEKNIVVLVPRYFPKNRILPPGGNLPHFASYCPRGLAN